MTQGFRDYLRRKDFGTVECAECGPMTERQISHIASDLIHWLWEHRTEEIPANIYEITKMVEGEV